jgi:hypothetical protein
MIGCAFMFWLGGIAVAKTEETESTAGGAESVE